MRMKEGLTQNSRESRDDESELDFNLFDIPSWSIVKLLDDYSDGSEYKIIGEGLQEITGVSTILVFSFDNVFNRLSTRAILGDEGHVAVLNKVLVDCLESTVLNRKAQQMLALFSGKLVQISGGLFELTNGNITQDQCVSLLKVIDITNVYTVGFYRKEQLYGGALLFPEMELKGLDPYVVESFIKIVSIILRRIKTEKEMRSSEQEYRKLLGLSINMLPDKTTERDVSTVRQLFQRNKKGKNAGTKVVVQSASRGKPVMKHNTKPDRDSKKEPT